MIFAPPTQWPSFAEGLRFVHMLGAHVQASKTQKRRARKRRTNERIAADGQQIDDRSRNHKRHKRQAPPAELQQQASSLQLVAAAAGIGANSDRSDWFDEIFGDAVRWRYPPSTFLDPIHECLPPPAGGFRAFGREPRGSGDGSGGGEGLPRNRTR